MNMEEKIFLIARKYKIGQDVIRINKNDLFPNLVKFRFQDELVFDYSSPIDLNIGKLSEIASIVKGMPQTNRLVESLGNDFFFVVPDIRFFSSGSFVSIPFILEEDEDMRNQRISFIQTVMEHGITKDVALEYSYYHVNDAYYGTRYSDKEEKLDFLRSLL